MKPHCQIVSDARCDGGARGGTVLRNVCHASLATATGWKPIQWGLGYPDRSRPRRPQARDRLQQLDLPVAGDPAAVGRVERDPARQQRLTSRVVIATQRTGAE